MRFITVGGSNNITRCSACTKLAECRTIYRRTHKVLVITIDRCSTGIKTLRINIAAKSTGITCAEIIYNTHLAYRSAEEGKPARCTKITRLKIERSEYFYGCPAYN